MLRIKIDRMKNVTEPSLQSFPKFLCIPTILGIPPNLWQLQIHIYPNDHLRYPSENTPTKQRTHMNPNVLRYPCEPSANSYFIQTLLLGIPQILQLQTHMYPLQTII